MSVKVNTVPFYLLPFFWIYGYGLGWFITLVILILHYTCRISFVGEENLTSSSHHILALWHHNNFPYFVVFASHKKPHVWMNHPAWYMKPVHVILKLIGIKKIILGSSNHEGKKAADQVVEYLKQGYSTFINPDGPNGPTKVLKKGVLHLAQQSQVPIIPVSMATPHCITLKKTWDQKRIPLPFSKIIVTYGKALHINEKNLSEPQIKQQLLGALDTAGDL